MAGILACVSVRGSAEVGIGTILGWGLGGCFLLDVVAAMAGLMLCLIGACSVHAVC